MTSSQLDGSESDNTQTLQPDPQVSVGTENSTVPAALSREDVLMSGALRISEESTSFQTATQNMSGNIHHRSISRRTSLEALESAPLRVTVTLPDIEDAISTALPASEDEELLRKPIESTTNVISHSETQGTSSQSPVTSYKSTIKTLSLHLPHLEKVNHRSRRRHASVTCDDYTDDGLTSVENFSVRRESRELQTPEGMSLRQYLEGVPLENLRLRLIVANDLSSDLIECLGTSYAMSPEVYEEHLVNSGWQNGTYNDQEPETWITRDMKKSHMSIKWYRPVKRILQRPYSTTDRSSFLAATAQPFGWTEIVPDAHGEPHKVQHKSRPTTNILRQDWDLKTDAEATISVGAFAALEERATVWNKQCDGYQVALFLLDPLPIVKDEMTGAVEALQRLDVYQTKPSTKPQSMNKGGAEKPTKGTSVTNQPARGLVKSTTFIRYTPKAERNFSLRTLGRLLFGDPSRRDGLAPEEPGTSQSAEDPESGGHGRDPQQKVAGIRRPKGRRGLPKFFDRFFGRSGKKTENVDRAEALDVPEEKQGTEIKTLRPMHRCIFEGLYPRGPALDYDSLMAPENGGSLAEYLDRTKPTAVSFAEWLIHNGRKPLTAVSTFHMVYLFAIIQNDTMNILRHMSLALQEIARHMLDDTLIQQRLVHWRVLLERFGNELQQLEDSLRQFANFISSSGPSHENNEKSPDRLDSHPEKLLEESITQINSLRQRTTRTQKSLMANMSIVESKRGIAEAESVTKLTELAFFFIPLTFSASIFSMQVKELDASRISIADFVALAVIITTASYALRLLIRSEGFIRRRNKMLKDIRQDADLARGSPISTKVFLAWIWRRVGLLILIVTVLVALLVIPVAVLWTRDMNHGFKVLLTILLLVFILAASYVTGNAMLYIDARGLHLRRDIFKPGTKVSKRYYQSPVTFSQSVAYLFSWLFSPWFWRGMVVTGVCAGPTAPLWTSQLTIGIKVGVTIVIAMLYVGLIVAILLRALQKISSRRRAIEGENDDF